MGTGSTSETDAPVTSASIKQVADALKNRLLTADTDGSLWSQLLAMGDVSQDPTLKSMAKFDAASFDEWAKDLGRLADEIDNLGEVSSVVEVKLNDSRDGFAINVSVARRKVVHGIPTPLANEPGSFAERYVVKEAEEVPKKEGAVAFLFSFVRDNSFGVSAANTIARRGDTNYPAVAFGYLQHFRATGDRLYYTMGVGLGEDSAATAVAGISLRTGDRDRSGFLTLGFVASQVAGLKNLEVGDPWPQGEPIPTRKSFKYGFGLAFSYSIG